VLVIRLIRLMETLLESLHIARHSLELYLYFLKSIILRILDFLD